MIKIEGKTVILNGNIFTFQNTVLDAVSIEQKLLVVFQPDNADNSKNNLYCYDLNKKMIWRIQEPSTDIAGTVRFPYIGLCVQAAQQAVVDF